MSHEQVDHEVARQTTEAPELGRGGERNRDVGVACARGDHPLFTSQRPLGAAQHSRHHQRQAAPFDVVVQRASRRTERDCLTDGDHTVMGAQMVVETLTPAPRGRPSGIVVIGIRHGGLLHEHVHRVGEVAVDRTSTSPQRQGWARHAPPVAHGAPTLTATTGTWARTAPQPAQPAPTPPLPDNVGAHCATTGTTRAHPATTGHDSPQTRPQPSCSSRGWWRWRGGCGGGRWRRLRCRRAR
ncbi:MAG: hypothetical protein JWM12_2634 [Ilumatobacteraceae bacterium]|nr:hypothetical protein [Ilumatobacteraceae bacterium]